MARRDNLVLNVDDNEVARYAKSRALSRATEIEVIEAASGFEALVLVKERRPTLVLLDVKLPDMSGFDVCRIIKQDYPETLVLQTSASFISGGDRTRGLDAGADSYLAQPCEPAELVASVRALLRIRATEMALRESEANFRTLAENIPTLCWMAAAHGGIYWYNKRWYDYTGCTPEQMKSWGWRSVHDRAVLPAVIRRWRKSLKTGTAFEMVFPLRGNDGLFRPFLTRVAPVTDDSGRIIRWFGTNTDISKQTEIENKLRDLNETLEQRVQSEVAARVAAENSLHQLHKVEALGQLTGGIAHDFNNMLAVIIGGLTLLKRKLARGQTDVERYIDGALDGAERAAALTRRLLGFSRQQPLTVEPVCTNDMISDMTDLLSRTLGEHIHITTVLAPDSWMVETDRSQLENALLNMSVNARDAMPDGGELRIETANVMLPRRLAQEFGIPAGPYLRIAVTDTGTGMSEEVAARAFDPFFTTKGVGKGTGLGLSQVFGFVRQTGGHVTIATALGNGTTIRLYLPRSKSAESEKAEPSIPLTTVPGQSHETVLVVEDEDRVRAMAVGALQGLGYNVLEAASASEALDVVSAGQPITLLFTDLVMPEMNGSELASLALARAPNLKVLFTTGYAPDDNGDVQIRGVDSRPLHKPYSLEQLSRRVRSAIDG
ncbi:response regulator [Labrys okinawensis]|uniref:response regulator n=1 Tax=Labrys okinawensis TaxID=346911 RepID=UPI0039BC4E47